MSIRTVSHRMATLGTSLGLVFLCTDAWAATVTVGPSGRDFTTIQAAVDSAMAGDRIEIDAGSYSEEVAIDKDLTVVGAGSDATLLSSDGLPLSLSEALVQVTGLGITAGGERGILISGGFLGPEIFIYVSTPS